MNAVRKLADPLADVTALDNLVQGVITNNPFQCVSYNAQGVNHRQLNAAGRITPHESSTRT